jgi:hypothetical protein
VGPCFTITTFEFEQEPYDNSDLRRGTVILGYESLECCLIYTSYTKESFTDRGAARPHMRLRDGHCEDVVELSLILLTPMEELRASNFAFDTTREEGASRIQGLALWDINRSSHWQSARTELDHSCVESGSEFCCLRDSMMFELQDRECALRRS